jgi:hypothetical protein
MTQGKGWEQKRESHEPGIDGGIMERQGENNQGAANAYVCVAEVANLEESMKKVEAAGGKLVGEKLDIPTVGLLHYAMDTEGNHFSMLEPPAEMKSQG